MFYFSSFKPVVDEKEIKFLLKTYAKLDPSPEGEDGIPVESFLSLYIFAGNELARRVVLKHARGPDRTIQPEGFLLCLSVLSKKADYPEKSKGKISTVSNNIGTGILEWGKTYIIMA